MGKIDMVMGRLRFEGEVEGEPFIFIMMNMMKVWVGFRYRVH